TVYAAVTVWVPTLSAEVLSVAVPELSATGACGVPSMVKVTVPLGVPEPGETALTVAVNVTVWPETDGLAEETTVVALLALLTVWVNGVAVLLLVLKLESPL